MNKDILIDIVHDVPCLWDRNNKDHHNRHVLGKEWRKVARKCGSTALEAKVCWKNLRQEFGKQLKRIELRSDNVIDPSIIQWCYFEKLFFLKDQFPYMKSTNNFVVEPSKELFDDNVVLETKINPYSDDDTNLSPRPLLVESTESPSVMNDNLSHMPVSLVYSSHNKSVTKLRLKKRKTSQMDQFAESEKSRLELEKRKKIQNENDEDIAFFDSILPTVRKLSSRDKFIFRMTVQQNLFELAFPHTEVITASPQQNVNVFTEPNPELVQEVLDMKANNNSYIKEENFTYEGDNL